ncbi:hypothetical protein [Prevotella bivia]|uniref:hypothetical protein n=1 Tax=Prevotella bivia TaxID=28125 RepID=UPI00288A9E9A|nr:hypothetical protein [Prevotella bivia]
MADKYYNLAKIIIWLLLTGCIYLIAEDNRYHYIKISDDTYAVFDKWTRTYRVGIVDFDNDPYSWQRHDLMPEKISQGKK